MATSSTISSTLPLIQQTLSLSSHNRFSFHGGFKRKSSRTNKRPVLRIRAAKLPPGVENPKVEPKITPPFVGFTRVAETWNARACMIGLIGTFVVELTK
ncbi:hypothetical protein Syun_000515 [Stephania yunnanensis]|uniref:Uncharacterized protein n=1 Tax=Stephania yunnanensis TaxID=152371 RepID=A0AAP0LEY3_9MAGN